MNKKVIVTGGAGFIGSNLVDVLVKEGYEVHVIDNLIAGKKEQVNGKATLHVKDIRSLEDIESLFNGVDVVFHLAALPRVQDSIDDPIPAHDVNVNGTVNVLLAASKHKVRRVVFTSSAAVYGDSKDLPVLETSETLPINPYGLHKLIGEQYARLWNQLYNLETVCLRYFNAYGPRQSAQGAYPSVIAKFIDLKKAGKALTITGKGEQTRDFVHVFDIARANIAAAFSDKVGKGESINIGTGREISIAQLATLIGGEITYIPARLETNRSRSDITKAKQVLGWEPEVVFEKAIEELKGN